MTYVEDSVQHSITHTFQWQHSVPIHHLCPFEHKCFRTFLIMFEPVTAPRYLLAKKSLQVSLYKFHLCAAGGTVTLDEAKFQAHFHFDVHEGCAGEQDAKGRWGIPRDGWISLLEGVFLVPKSSDSRVPAGVLMLPRTRITYERHQKLSLSLLHILWCFSTFEF